MINDILSGWNGRILLAIFLVVLIAFPWLAGEQGRFYTVLLMTVYIFGTLGHAWNLLAGYSGLLSFGLQVYVGLGGFTIGLLSFYGGVNVWLAMPIAALSSILFAWLLAVPISERFLGKRVVGPMAIAIVLWILYEILISFEPSFDIFRGHYTRRVSILLLIFLGALPLLKLQGAYFAVATWLIAAAVSSVFSEWKLTGAGGGLSIASDTSIEARYYAGLILMVLSTFVVWYLLRSKYGQALTAVRDDEEAASSIGIDIRRVKTLVFLISAPMAGLAAGLFYIDNVTITPTDAFSIRWSAVVVFVVVAGGMGSLAGPIIGAVIFVIVDRLVSEYIGTGELALGVFSVLIILLLPRGVMGVINDLRQKERKRRPRSVRAEPSGFGPFSGGQENSKTNYGWKTEEVDKERLPPGLVSAYLVPGNPLPYLRPNNPSWVPIIDGFKEIQKSLMASKPDVLLVYSTQWMAVLDQLWQTRPRLHGTHVDENWYEYGDLPYDISIDRLVSERLVAASKAVGVSSKAVNYDQFPIDTGTIVANNLLNPDGRIPLVIAANNLYHDFDLTRRLGALAVKEAIAEGRRVSMIGIGGLSGSMFREEIQIEDDRIVDGAEDRWNQRILELISSGDRIELDAAVKEFAFEANADMGFKHFAWLLGGMGDSWRGAHIHAYGPTYGSGAAVIEFKLETDE
jgi:ABC-type branched-subunit amino acid transport system permease subunit/aromatic ring-opening dioxygenase catalytic subunit (LigB family)